MALETNLNRMISMIRNNKFWLKKKETFTKHEENAEKQLNDALTAKLQYGGGGGGGGGSGGGGEE